MTIFVEFLHTVSYRASLVRSLSCPKYEAGHSVVKQFGHPDLPSLPRVLQPLLFLSAALGSRVNQYIDLSLSSHLTLAPSWPSRSVEAAGPSDGRPGTLQSHGSRLPSASSTVHGHGWDRPLHRLLQRLQSLRLSWGKRKRQMRKQEP